MSSRYGRDLDGGGRNSSGAPGWLKGVAVLVVLGLVVALGVKGCSELSEVKTETRYEVIKLDGR